MVGNSLNECKVTGSTIKQRTGTGLREGDDERIVGIRGRRGANKDRYVKCFECVRDGINGELLRIHYGRGGRLSDGVGWLTTLGRVRNWKQWAVVCAMVRHGVRSRRHDKSYEGRIFDVRQCQEAMVVKTGEMWSIVLICYWVDWIVINMIVESVRWVISLNKNCLTSECDVFK